MKRSFLLLALLLVLFVPWTNADPATTIVADGTATTSYVPVYGNYAEEAQVAQIIYPASMLDAMLPGDTITSLHFYVSSGDNSSKWDQSTFEVRLANTTQANLSSAYDQTASTLVYSGYLTANTTDGMTVTFTTPFVYTGGNLLVQFSQPTGSAFSNVNFSAVAYTGGSRYKKGSTDITSGGNVNNFLPKCQITYNPYPVTCLRPLAVAAGDVAATTASFSWNYSASAGAQYQYLCIPAGTEPDWTTAGAAISDTFCTVTDLNPNSDYVFYVRSYCGETDQSAHRKVSIHTLCIPVLPTSLGTIGFETSEGFVSGSGNLNGVNCWLAGNVQSPTNNNYIPYVQASYPYSGSNSLRIHSYKSSSISADSAYAVFPEFLYTGKTLDKYQVSLFVRKNNTNNYNDTLWLGVMSDPTDISTFTVVAPIVTTSTVYAEYLISFEDYEGTDGYVALLATVNPTSTATSRYGSFYVDDVTFSVKPACQPLQSITVSDVTRYSFRANWTTYAASNREGYKLLCTTADDPASATEAVIDVPDSVHTYLFENLERGTVYNVFAWCNCGETDSLSEYISVVAKTEGIFVCDSTIGTGTVAIDGVPAVSNYGNTYSQQIFKADELIAKGVQAGEITAMSYTWNQSSSSVKHLQIYLAHTEKESFASTTDWEPASSFTQCLDMPEMRVTAAGKADYYFFTPFIWDGVSNIVVATIVNQTETSKGSTGFKAIGTQYSDTLALYTRQDNTEYSLDPTGLTGTVSMKRANISFCQEGAACPAVKDILFDNISQYHANVSWTASTGDFANDYDVLVSTTPVTDFTGVTPQYTNLDTTGLALDSLNAYTNYYVYVRVNCNAAGRSDGSTWSEAAQFKTLSRCITPTDFDVEALSKTSVKATWTHNEAQTPYYRYILRTEEVADPETETPDVTGISADSVVITGLTPAQTYYLYLSNNCGGEDGTSPYIMTSFTMPDACLAPVTVSASDMEKYQFTINWIPSQYADPTDLYTVALDTAELADPATATFVADSVNGTSYTFTSLLRNTLYHAYVRCACGAETTEWISTTASTTYDFDCSNTVTLDGNTSQANVPYSSCYDYGLTEQIYLASELNGAGYISAMKFKVASSPKTSNISIYLVNTSKSSFSSASDWVTVSADDRVYQGTYAFATGWNEITFSKKFYYNGTDNLMLVVDNNTGSYSCTMQFSGYSSSSNTAIYKNQDGTDINPLSSVSVNGSLGSTKNAVEFVICGPADPCPTVQSVDASNVTNTVADIIWTSGKGDFASSYDVILSDSVITDFEGKTPTVSNLTDTFYTFTGLNANTDYYAYVRVNCVNETYDDGSSVWSAAGTFATELPCLKPENFRAKALFSDRALFSWTKVGTATDWKLYISGDTIDTVSVNIADCAVVGDTVNYLLLGMFVPESDYTIKLQADCGAEGMSKLAADTLNIHTLNNVTGFQSFAIRNAEVMNGDTVTIDFENHYITATLRKGSPMDSIEFYQTWAHWKCTPTVNGVPFTSPWDFTAPVTVRIYAQDTLVYQDWTIEFVEEACATPYEFSASNVQRRTVDLSWKLGDMTATSFDLVVSNDSLENPAEGTIQSITVPVNPVDSSCAYTLTGLTRDTAYVVYLRSNCGSEFSEWRQVEFRTKALTYCLAATVGGDDVTSSNTPVYGLYCDAAQRTQSIYPATMLTDLVGKTISELKYFVYSGNNATKWDACTFNVRMGITAATNLLNAFASETLTEVYSGTLIANTTDNMVVVLDEPFVYTGGNLVIEFELPEASNSYTSVYFKGHDYNVVLSRYEYETYSGMAAYTDAVLPRVQFTYCVQNDPCPTVSDVQATDIDVNGATISWTKSEGDYANTSDIYYSTEEVTDFTGVTPQVTGVTGTSAPITGLNQYTDYYVYVRTHCDGEGQDDGISGWTSGIVFRTLAPCRVPGKPAATITGKHTATVAWTNTSDTMAQADNFTYILSATPIALEDLESTTPTATAVAAVSAQLTNLLSETTYHFYVRNECGISYGSSPWDSCQFTMYAEMPAVTNLEFSDVAHNAFRATWEVNTAEFANETAWEVAVTAHGEEPQTWTPVTTPEYFALSLEAETQYDFYVHATDGAGHYSLDKMDSVTTGPVPTDCNEIVAGTSTVSNAPMYSNYQGSYSVVIYTADELLALGCVPGNIESINYYQTTCSNTTLATKYQKTTTLWMGNTTKESFANSSDWMAGLTQVMNPVAVDFNKVNDYVTMTLDQPFAWDGTSNIAVAVLAYSSSYTSMTFAGGIAADGVARCIYSYKDSENWTITNGVPSITDNVYASTSRPNIEFCFTPQSCPVVTNLKVDQCATTSARAHWYPGDNGQANFEYYVSTEDLTKAELDSVVATPTTSTVVSLAGLTKDEDYYIYVRGFCAEGDTSLWMKQTFRTLPSCSAPDTIVVTTIGDNDVKFEVTAAGEYGTVGTYDYRYWMVGSADTTTVAGQTSELTVTGLAAGLYNWQVRANCSGSDEGASRWADGEQFRVCGVFALPYNENFETHTVDAAPGCWDVLRNGVTYSYYPAVIYSGTKVLAISENSSIATPQFVVPTDGARVSFQIRRGYNYHDGSVAVGFTTDVADSAAFIALDTITLGSTTAYSDRFYDISVGDTVGQIVFTGIKGYYNDIHYIDNVVIEPIPTVELTLNVLPDSTCGNIEVILDENDTISGGRIVKGAEIALVAHEAEGRTFVQWLNAAGDTIGYADTLRITLSADTTISAEYVYNDYKVNTYTNNPTMGTATGGGTYPYGTVITVTATPNEHIDFINWTVNDTIIVSTDAVFAYTVTGNVTLKANFDIESDTIDLQFNPNKGSVVFIAEGDTSVLTSGKVPVYYNTPVKLIAVAAEHCTFVSWNGTVTNDTIEFTVVADTVLNPVFVGESHIVTTAVEGEGMVTGAGTYEYGDNVTLTAIPDTGYMFTGWSTGDTTDVLTFVLTSDTTITATFAPIEYYVTVNVIGGGTVTGQGIYYYGDTVTLTAIADAGYKFSKWNNGDTSTVVTFVIYSDTLLSAEFIVWTSVEDVEADGYVAYVEGNDVVVLGAADRNVALYDMDGRLIQMISEASDYERINVNVAGVYIIRVEGLTSKRVLVK